MLQQSDQFIKYELKAVTRSIVNVVRLTIAISQNCCNDIISKKQNIDGAHNLVSKNWQPISHYIDLHYIKTLYQLLTQGNQGLMHRTTFSGVPCDQAQSTKC